MEGWGIDMIGYGYVAHYARNWFIIPVYYYTIK